MKRFATAAVGQHETMEVFLTKIFFTSVGDIRV